MCRSRLRGALKTVSERDAGSDVDMRYGGIEERECWSIGPRYHSGNGRANTLTNMIFKE